MRASKLVFISLLGLYCVAALALFLFQRSLVFGFDAQRLNPQDLGLPNVREVTLQSAAGAKLYSWYAAAQVGKPTLLYLHGNSGSVGSRSEIYPLFTKHGYGVFMVGYPGYGGSEGEPSEESFVEAAQVAYKHLREMHLAPDDIVLFGESLGSSVAAQLATTVDARALVLAAPMYSIREIAEQQYPFFPIRYLLRDPFLTFERIGAIQMPLFVAHGSADQTIPVDSGRRLFALAKEPKEFHLMDGAGHNNLFDFALVELMDSYLLMQ